ncbi:hypothetical protein ILUMI_07130 [Ignelater luminosus]|uniref:Uncharacterized protein n=1 Tax=Ignelater luminosus TaxID=2038154 RepID=A0A8K0D9C7_IGNLU|nr:hypothetical protein ILUMI_07130 [Ignelater luminosus]
MAGANPRPPSQPQVLVEEGTAIVALTNPTAVPEGSIPLGILLQPPFGEDVYSFSKADVVRVVRLLLEALESAFFLCNIFLDSYGLAKIFDIVNQIMPTAYVYNTSYWIFYKSQYGECLCVCERFGIKCFHRKNAFHFINLDPLPENIEGYFAIPLGGKLYPNEANVSVTPVMSDMLRAYEIKIDLVVQQLVINENGFTLPNEEKVTLTIESRYMLTPEHHALRDIALLLSPHPMTQYVYSSYFENLHQFHLFLNGHRWETHVPRTYTIVSTDLPKFTVVPTNLEFPLYDADLSSNYQAEYYEDYERHAQSRYGAFAINVRGTPVQKADHRTQLFLCYTRNYDATKANRYTVLVRQIISEKPFPAEYIGPLRDFASGPLRPKATSSSKSKKRGRASKLVKVPTEANNTLSSTVPLSRSDQRQAASRTFNPTIKKPEKAKTENKVEQVEHNFLGPDYDVLFPSLPQPGCSKTQNRPTEEDQKKVSSDSKGKKKNKTKNVEEPSTIIVIDEPDNYNDLIIVDEVDNEKFRTDEDIIIEDLDNDVVVVDNEETWHIINDIINGEIGQIAGDDNDSQDVIITIDDNDLDRPSTSGTSRK